MCTSVCDTVLYYLIHSRMPGWVQPMIPRILYVTEKGWNFYPYTKTGTCKYSITTTFVVHIYVIYYFFSFLGCILHTKEYTVSAVIIIILAL